MTGPIDDRKIVLRRDLRKSLAGVGDVPVRSAGIVAQILGWDRVRVARTVMASLPLAGEADITLAAAAVLGRGSRLCLPRVDWTAGVMRACEVDCLDRGLVAGRAGLLEPPEGSPAIPITDIDLVLVPGLGFDLQGGRIGRGGGFYDRFLAPAADRLGRVSRACGVGFDAQVVEEVPMGPMDIRLGAVATETRLILT